MKIYLLAVAAAIVVHTVSAQTNDENLKGGTQVVVKAHNPTIKESSKINDRPQFVDSVQPAPSVQYSILSKQLGTSFQTEPIAPAKMKGEPVSKLYRAHLKMGFGNYLTTYGELFLNNGRSRKHNWGVHMSHLASNGGINDVGHNGYGQNLVNLNGKKFLKKHMLSGDLNYDRHAVHFYGYDPTEYQFDKKDIKQRFQTIGGNARSKSFYKDSTKVNHDVGLNYYNLTDLYNAQENNVRANVLLNKYFASELFTMDVVADYNRFANSMDTISNVIAGVTPRIISKGKKWRLNAGLGMYIDADDVASFRFYPEVYFKYNVVSDLIIPYAGITGKTERNSFASLSNENPFIVSELPLRNTSTRYQVFAGIRGAISSNLSFNLKGSVAELRDMPLFVNDTLMSAIGNRFTVAYDTVKLTTLGGELIYTRSEKLNILAKGEYFVYDTKAELAAWHKPDFKATVSGVYSLKDKIVARADVFYLGRQKARSFSAADGEYLGYNVYEKRLGGVLDVNLGVEYRYTKRLSAFLNVNNIMSSRYQRWNNYPTQRFNLMGGISYSFWAN